MTNFASKALTQSLDTNFANLTNEKCIDFCLEKGYAIAGTQSGSQCFCGNDISEQTLFIEETACATSCTGDDSEVCGDNQKLSVYATFNISGSVFDRETVREEWIEVGCFEDGRNGNHSLTGAAYACLGMTIEMCMNFCDVMGFPVAGLEYGGECYCGDSFENGGGGCSGGCSTPCIGDDTQMCGGDWKMNVYERIDIKSPLEMDCEFNGGCALGNGSQYNLTAAWGGNSIHWDAVMLPNTTDVCSVPCEVVTYYPYFVWEMHENIRLKIADRLAVDWPERIASLIEEDCNCEIEEIATAIKDCGNISYGLNGTADTWLCDVISTIEKL